jgi:hypothetical protein
MIIFSFFYIVLNAIAWRFRGGGFFETGSTQFVRLVAGISLSIPIVFFFDSWLYIWIIPVVFLGLVFSSWGDFFDMGTNENPKSEELVSPLIKWLDPGSVIHDVVGMSLTGIVMISPLLLFFWLTNTIIWYILIAGLLMGPIYLISWRLIKHSNAIVYAEFAMGAILSAAILFSLI